MNDTAIILWVSAHPEPASLNHSLRSAGIAELENKGCTVIQSDLYAMNWDPVLRREQFSHAINDHDGRFDATRDVRDAFLNGEIPDDIHAEQQKLLAADAVILQFPLWWYGPPAILKGWFDRVLHSGFAFGKDPATGTRLRFENGPFRGKRALVVTTLGDRPAAIGPRGISGEFCDLMFGLLHGTLGYTGFEPLPPVTIPSADFTTESDYRRLADSLRGRLDGLFSDEPMRPRPQFQGDYTQDWELRDTVVPGDRSLRAHWL